MKKTINDGLKKKLNIDNLITLFPATFTGKETLEAGSFRERYIRDLLFNKL